MAYGSSIPSPLFGTESLGLAAGQTMPALGRSQLADRFAKIEAQFAERADAAATGTATGTATPAARTAANGKTRPKEEGLSGSTDPLTVHDIVRRYTESCVIKHFDHLSAQVLSTLV